MDSRLVVVEVDDTTGGVESLPIGTDVEVLVDAFEQATKTEIRISTDQRQHLHLIVV